MARAAAGRSGMRGAVAECMNAIFFGLKRAFHGTLRVTRPCSGGSGSQPRGSIF